MFVDKRYTIAKCTSASSKAILQQTPQRSYKLYSIPHQRGMPCMHRLKRKGAIRCIRRLKYLYHAQAKSLPATTCSHCAVVFPLRGKADAYGEVPGKHPL